MVEISKVIYYGKLFKFRNWDKPPVNPTSLSQTVIRLFTMLRDRRIDHVLVGGVALLQYIEGRNTEDIDLILSAQALEELPEIQITDQNSDFAQGHFGELRIDLLLTTNRLFNKVQQRYTVTHPFAELALPCATVEGLLLLKMYALPALYRQGDFTRVSLYENDIRTLLYAYQPSMEPLFQELVPHLAASDLREIRNILAEIQQRIDRFRANTQTPPDTAPPPPPDLER